MLRQYKRMLDGSHDINSGWKCNTGYHEKNGECERDCIANNCSGYPLSSCPANANCSKCTITATNCSTDGTKYKIDSCNDGYTLSGNVCRALTCEEKGQKTCNGSCIATSECCGGCPSGKRCSNGSCVADKYYVNISVSLNGSTGQNYNIGLRDDGCPVDKKPLQGISIISGPNAGKSISLYPKCRSLGGSTNFKEDVFCTQTTCNFSFEVSPGDTISVSTYGDLFFACGYPDVTDNLGNPIYAAEDKILTPVGTTYYYFDFNCIH